jgi:hypothetical protein
VVEWSSQIQREGMYELGTLPPGGVIRGQFMPDYGRMQDQARACQKAR